MRMRRRGNGVTASQPRPTPGSTGVLLAFDIEDALQPSLLGFAIWRSDGGQ
jgi:hypothetical protein